MVRLANVLSLSFSVSMWLFVLVFVCVFVCECMRACLLLVSISALANIDTQDPVLHLEREDRFGQGRHHLTAVGRDDSGKQRDTSRDGLSGDEAKDTQHGKATVVDLLHKTGLLLLGSFRRGELERVVQVEGTAGDVLGIEGWELTDLASLHVVLLTSNLAVLSMHGRTTQHNKIYECENIMDTNTNAESTHSYTYRD